jgi:ankyrin repeat protein
MNELIRQDTVRAPETLVFAARNGHVDLVRSLLENGWDVNARMPYGRTPLVEAVIENQIDVVRALIEHGVDVKIDSAQPAIYLAVRAGKNDIVMLLMEAGATSVGHQTLMDVAIWWNNESTILLLSSYRIPTQRHDHSYDLTTVPALMRLIHNFPSDIWRMVKWMLL